MVIYMGEKRESSKERMQTQAKPSNRNNERNMIKTIDNIDEKKVPQFKNKYF